MFPNFFSGIFRNQDSDEKFTFLIYKETDHSHRITEFVKGNCLIGYNNSSYDNIILSYIIKNRGHVSNKHLYNLSQYIINSQRSGNLLWKDEKLKPYIRNPFYSIDLMKILGFDKLKIGLKQVAVNLNWHRIQDLPKPFNEDVEEHEVDDILDYNDNDVLITKALRWKIDEEIELRNNISNLYSINLMNSSNSAIADKIMSVYYSDRSGISQKELRKRKTFRSEVHLKYCISSRFQEEYFKFKTPEMIKTYDFLMNHVVKIGEKKKKKGKGIYTTIFKGKRYTIGLGGLHSDNPSKIYRRTKSFDLIDIDFGSYYPNLIRQLKVHPAHLHEDHFMYLADTLTTERLKAKANQDKNPSDKVKAAALKIAANSGLYGKLNFISSWTYDPKASYSVTINGQLFLLSLIEKLELAGFEVIYCNTDGLTIKCSPDRRKALTDLCNEFETHVGISLEHDEFDLMVLRDVNNFLIRKLDGKFKRKGTFIKESSDHPSVVNELRASYDKPIVSHALHEYFVNGVKPEDYIPTVENIGLFLMSQKVGKQFEMRYYHIVYKNNLPEQQIDKLQKTNRFFVSKNGGKLMKYKKETESLHNLVSGRKVTLFNDHFESDDYRIDYSYYIAETWRVINSCTNNFQLDLFN